MKTYGRWMGVLAVGVLWSAGSCLGMVLPGKDNEAVSIRIAADAGERIEQAAAELSMYLEKIFSVPFPVTKDPGEKGIILGTVKGYPEFQTILARDVPGATEGYLIKSAGDRLLLIGASPSGTQNAVWDLLERLGYRQYFPGKTWEIVPQLKRFVLDMDIASFPSYAARRIFITHNIWPELRAEFKEWQKRNRLDSGLQFSTGHSYDAIIERHKEEFAKHPGYLTKPLGSKNNKFVISEKGLRDLVVADAVAELRANPEMTAISLDPSDGQNWPESSSLGSESNQAVTLANAVAEALQTVKPGVKVAMYAYSQHSPPPGINVDSNVVVSVATAFLREGFTFEEILKGWSERGASLGVRDYLGVWAWSNDLPGRGRATSPAQVARAIAEYYQLGARYYTAEANHGFGAGGLGLYTAALCLWDVRKADQVDEIRREFLDKSFGSAAAAMAVFYQVIDGDSSPLLSEHLLGSMYRALAEAYEATADDAVLRRIDALAAYTRFVELFMDYRNADPRSREQTFDAVANYGKRIRSLGMAHTWALISNQPKRDSLLKGSKNTKEIKSNTESFTAPTHEEFRQFVRDGIDRNPIQTFTPVSFSSNLVPLPKNRKGVDGEANCTVAFRGGNSFYTHIIEGKPISFTVKGGLLYGDRGAVRIKLYPLLEPLGQSVAELEVPADKNPHPVTLKSTFGGLHRIEVQDGNDQTSITWPAESLPIAIPSGPDSCAKMEGRYTMSFYVPKGTKSVAGYSDNQTGSLVDADGNSPFRFSDLKGGGYFDISVPAGQDDKVWEMKDCRGRKLLMTVPAYLSPSKEMMLVPKEALPQ